MSKAEKLAAARKKLKEFQEKSKDNTSSGTRKNSRDSVNSNQNVVFDSGPQEHEALGSRQTRTVHPTNLVGENTSLVFQETRNPSFHNTADLTNYNYTNNQREILLQSASPDSNRSSSNVSLDRSSARDFFDNFPGQTHDWLVNQNLQPGSANHCETNTSMEVDQRTSPEQAPTETYGDVFPLPYGSGHIDLTKDLSLNLPVPHQKSFDTKFDHADLNKPESKPSIMLESQLDTFHLSEDQQHSPVSARSTSESIRQLSLQMTGLVGESMQTTAVTGASELEGRNQELAALLEMEQQSTEKLQLQLKEYQVHVAELSSQLESHRAEAETRLQHELASVQEQLKLHIQTVGILVAEKTELQSALTHCQADAKLKVSETEDLAVRLKASRYRASELEKELTAMRVTHEATESAHRAAAAELDRLRLEQIETTSKMQEAEEERAELTHKLTAKTSECTEFSKELHETKTRLSLVQLRVTQLSSEDAIDSTAQMEALHQAKLLVEQRVTELEGALKASEAEHDKSSQQFQQYVRGVENQVSELTEKVESLEKEKRTLTEREQSLMGHMAELEKRIQLQDQHKVERSSSPNKELQERLIAVETEKQALCEELQGYGLRFTDLEAGLQERESRIEELETMVDRMQGDQPDQGRLLAAMESDKVAAARAVSQNQSLKLQLQELQDGFVTLSNCKADLTDKLEHERHRTKLLERQISELRLQVEEQRKAAEAHDHQHHDHSHGGHGHSHGPGGHDQLANMLRLELAQSKTTMEALSRQNSELRTQLAEKDTLQGASTEGSEVGKDDMVSSLSASVRQLELEKSQLKERLGAVEKSRASDGMEVPTSGLTQDAMKQLQEQFTKKMTEIADLSDEKQRLEHLVLQLQGETETIGEYITLYQKQRGLLRQRAEEKDNQLKCLAQDREEMRTKLSQLNNLISRLVTERAAGETDFDAVDVAQREITNGDLLEMEKHVLKDTSSVGKSEATPHPTEKADTAGKIMALLTEIGTSNLVDPHQPVEHFHPCAWCSGRLITV